MAGKDALLMASQIYLFDRYGIKIGELYQDCTREWVLNSPGDAEISISFITERERLFNRDLRKLLQFGNLVFVPNDRLGDWAGVITNRNWKSGILTIVAKGLEYLLTFGTPAAVDTNSIRSAPGEIFERLISMCNRQIETQVRIGEIYKDGPVIEHPPGSSDLLSSIGKLSTSTGEDYDLSGSIDRDNRLVVTANWYKRKELDLKLWLLEGHNFSVPEGDLLREDGSKMPNHFIGVPERATKEKQKPVTLIDEETSAEYGKRWASETMTNITGDETLLSRTQATLNRVKNPIRTVGGKVLDLDSAFDKTRIGSKVTAELYSAGFRENGELGCTITGRISGCRYTDKINAFEIVIREDQP
jgi:hypothetical protein